MSATEVVVFILIIAIPVTLILIAIKVLSGRK